MQQRRVPRTSAATAAWTAFAVTWAALFAVVLAAPRPAAAQVSEPNGVIAPVAVINGETSLQAYFDSEMETINAVANAAADPGVFLPLCDFQATLVLSQSNAQAGIAWYNVPADPNMSPAEIFPIGQGNLILGQTISSADVRSNPSYGLGLIGFVLMKNGQRVYYSEYRRNALCSGCTTPGYWKMALAYQSRRFPNTYYLAFEDWEGANTTTWFGNDGDFNDKVFRISGVTCEGGGEACDTQMTGVCAIGVTECQPGGTIVCKQHIQPTGEKCDNLDNDCNGTVDDGPGLCRSDEVCVRGTCIPPCGATEFDCALPFVCAEGRCVDPACIGVTCNPGQICRGGVCVGGCEGVTCPIGQECQLGVCVDPCAGVSCPGAVCERGACVTHCSCRACAIGMVCAPDGQCVDAGCPGLTCGVGQVCRGGACVDACGPAVCPGNAACREGMCEPPMIGAPGIDGGVISTGTGGRGGTGGGGTTTGAGGATGAGATDGGAGVRGGGPIKPACGCATTGGSAGDGAPMLLGAAFAGVACALAAGRRRRGRGGRGRREP